MRPCENTNEYKNFPPINEVGLELVMQLAYFTIFFPSMPKSLVHSLFYSLEPMIKMVVYLIVVDVLSIAYIWAKYIAFRKRTPHKFFALILGCVSF